MTMDKDGFLAGAGYDCAGAESPYKCQVCQKPLSSANGPRPAETYLGTLTGICYQCQNGPAYIERTEYDGAQCWSYPPHCPAWRRDRERFVGYADCPDCKGKPRIMISRCNSQGGLYPKCCPTCSDRYFNEPARKRLSKRRHKLHKAAERAFHAAVTAGGAADGLRPVYIERHNRAYKAHCG